MSVDSPLESLERILRREICLLRELLSSLRFEQESLIHGDPSELRRLHTERDQIVESMTQTRTQRLGLIERLEGDGVEPWEQDNFEVLREQMVCLLDAVKEQTTRNNGLLDGKVQLNRQMIQQLQPKDPNKTYGAHGQVKPAVKTATVTLINREV